MKKKNGKKWKESDNMEKQKIKEYKIDSTGKKLCTSTKKQKLYEKAFKRKFYTTRTFCRRRK